MSDLIFREDALIALGNEPPKPDANGYGITWEDGRRKQWVTDREIIKEVPTAGKRKRVNCLKYEEEIIKILENVGADLAVKDGKPINCETIRCSECDFGNLDSSCRFALVKWLYEEAE